MSAPAGRQSWRDVLFVHWAVDPAALRPLVPPTLDLDLRDGRAWVGLVPFAMLAVRPGWAPGWLGLDFLETNVRTYVRHRGEGPGVHFFSLEASSLLAVRAARWQWGLPYHHAAMRLERRGDGLRYESARHGRPEARHDIRAVAGKCRGPAAPGSLDNFLVERYLLYVERGGRLLRGRVHHPPWPLREAAIESLDEGLVAAAGIARPGGEPGTVHFSDGVDVEIFAPVPA